MDTDTAVTVRRASGRADFAELSRCVRDGGLLTRRRGYYTAKIVLTVGALLALAAVGVILGNSWWNLVVATGLAFVLVQLGFIAHDAGHRQISTRRRNNDLIGMVVTNLFTGFSFGWWLAKHNRHHAHTNIPAKDPDMTPGALVYTVDQVDALGPFGRMCANGQAVLLIPLLFLEALNLHVASVRSLAGRRDRTAAVEAGLLIVHAAVFFVAPFAVLSPLRALVFIAVTQSLFGFYLGVSFLTNHVGMPESDGHDDLGFLRRQVLTSRNLSGTAFTAFLFGGLDSQIEHHLFPTMPRANLRRARTLVRPFCADRSIVYREQSPWSAYREVVRHLHDTGAGRSALVIP